MPMNGALMQYKPDNLGIKTSYTFLLHLCQTSFSLSVNINDIKKYIRVYVTKKRGLS